MYEYRVKIVKPWDVDATYLYVLRWDKASRLSEVLVGNAWWKYEEFEMLGHERCTMALPGLHAEDILHKLASALYVRNA